MSWVLIAVCGVAAWLSVTAFFLALCREAGRADRLANAGSAPDPDVIDLRAARNTRRRGSPYFNSRDSRRSLSSLPSV